ncbi:MAG: VOC family protein [Pirellulaceae bacterium]|nr:VOC family protein [Pirellulaceae bacterium]
MNTSIAPQLDSDTRAPATAWFHLSLNVGELDRSVSFFRAFLGREPAKCRADYAKFELTDPPLVLSLEPGSVPPGGSLNHLGFRVSQAEALVDLQRRLELAGISTQREEGVECCYARQTKFWVHDPDGNLWEVYTLDDDLEHRGDGRLPAGGSDVTTPDGEAGSVWVHRLGDPFAQRLPILDASVDRVVLQGTLNARLSAPERQRQLGEVRRILRGGASVMLHMLTSDKPAGDEPIHLPGPAARVEVVPAADEVLAALAEAGFAEPQVVFLAQAACFRAGGCQFRETRVEARKP